MDSACGGGYGASSRRLWWWHQSLRDARPRRRTDARRRRRSNVGDLGAQPPQLRLLNSIFKQGLQAPTVEQMISITAVLNMYSPALVQSVSYWFHKERAKKMHADQEDEDVLISHGLRWCISETQPQLPPPRSSAPLTPRPPLAPRPLTPLIPRPPAPLTTRPPLAPRSPAPLTPRPPRASPIGFHVVGCSSSHNVQPRGIRMTEHRTPSTEHCAHSNRKSQDQKKAKIIVDPNNGGPTTLLPFPTQPSKLLGGTSHSISRHEEASSSTTTAAPPPVVMKGLDLNI
ncbi:uncharacterized protein LOC131148060 [Malania oleifera]|uniref:uncharacterized protein LOC131148060 n=1 Tax=Malania oleifera TaxID=397392 RepID=UPI0025ADD937|nr:uncharacterized protein LOC131148060 [Malania oleifera]